MAADLPGADVTPTPAQRAAWAAREGLRIEGFLPPGQAEALLAALRALPHPLRASEGALGFLYGECTLVPEPDCDHPLCAFGRWWHDAGRAFVADLSGLALASPADHRVVGMHYGKGGYLDCHNDYDGQRAVAYVLGLTPAAWPWEEGGHLEFVAVEGDAEVLVERRPPGFNTLDLFDVSTGGPLHRVPILTAHHERRTISGWFLRG